MLRTGDLQVGVCIRCRTPSVCRQRDMLQGAYPSIRARSGVVSDGRARSPGRGVARVVSLTTTCDLRRRDISPAISPGSVAKLLHLGVVRAVGPGSAGHGVELDAAFVLDEAVADGQVLAGSGGQTRRTPAIPGRGRRGQRGQQQRTAPARPMARSTVSRAVRVSFWPATVLAIPKAGYVWLALASGRPRRSTNDPEGGVRGEFPLRRTRPPTPRCARIPPPSAPACGR